MRQFADTSIISRVFKKSPEIALCHAHIHGAKLYISFQTVAEMRYGARKADWGSRRLRELEEFLTSYSVVEYSSALADAWARVMDEARSAGRRLEPDVASVFHDAATVNAALRLFIKLTQENPLTAPQPPA